MCCAGPRMISSFIGNGLSAPTLHYFFQRNGCESDCEGGTRAFLLV